MSTVVTKKGHVLQDPPFVQKILSDPRAGWVWFILRVWVGWQWIHASLDKISNPAWVGGGAALKGYWTNAIAIPSSGRPAIAFGWYRTFIEFMLNAQAYTWFAKLIAYGEFLVGLALILGAFTGIAAFFGGMMNWSYMMAGSASTNPMLFLISVLLILAWKVSGYIGADYFLLRWIGVPWHTDTLEQSGSSKQPLTGSAQAGD